MKLCSTLYLSVCLVYELEYPLCFLSNCYVVRKYYEMSSVSPFQDYSCPYPDFLRCFVSRTCLSSPTHSCRSCDGVYLNFQTSPCHLLIQNVHLLDSNVIFHLQFVPLKLNSPVFFVTRKSDVSNSFLAHIIRSTFMNLT